MPASYIQAEALTIDLHRRIALSEHDDELRELRAQLEGRAAAQAVVEGEIARAMDDYEQLRGQLVDQEEMQVCVCGASSREGG